MDASVKTWRLQRYVYEVTEVARIRYVYASFEVTFRYVYAGTEVRLGYVDEVTEKAAIGRYVDARPLK